MLLKHPAVAEAAVVGKKDPARGEVVVAFVTLREGKTGTEGEIRDFCRDQGLVQWKCPARCSSSGAAALADGKGAELAVLAERLESQ